MFKFIVNALSSKLSVFELACLAYIVKIYVDNNNPWIFLLLIPVFLIDGFLQNVNDSLLADEEYYDDEE